MPYSLNDQFQMLRNASEIKCELSLIATENIEIARIDVSFIDEFRFEHRLSNSGNKCKSSMEEILIDRNVIIR